MDSVWILYPTSGLSVPAAGRTMLATRLAGGGQRRRRGQDRLGGEGGLPAERISSNAHRLSIMFGEHRSSYLHHGSCQASHPPADVCTHLCFMFDEQGPSDM